ncbi:MAG TPA: molybdate ABC transporter substrate-binding protein [Methanoregulaceae archaeon]|nr:molybdate ABC transporter substrate-binding protein [Methanolinea sp.]MDD3091132.1 molybdate ABC transporter substrate-binding protein [Methanoregulaceae archaeon]HQC12288.1 molybdate ABC transporter substrate-binding protein [Methanoregulaceae archaeon]HRX33194.1 molybdate ABC transporter substrate-binding protein [Methanoregulaceae archaeon]
MNKGVFLFLAIACATSILMVCGCTDQAATVQKIPGQELSVSEQPKDPQLLVYCAAGMKDPMEEIAELYGKETGTVIEYTHGNAAQLLSQIELLQSGDAYMPGARPYIQTAIDKGYVNRSVDVVYHVMIIAVPKGNPADITSIQDLARPGVRVALGEPDGPAVGKAAKKMLERDGLWEAVNANTVVTAATVNELVVYLEMGQADATIIWEDLYNPGTMDIVEIPEDMGVVDVVPIGSLVFSKNPEIADDFIHYVSSDQAKEIFTKHGFTTYPAEKYGDR